MLKKRIIFCLLYKDGYFVQSRNFITNIIGDTNWIIKNYNFLNILILTFSIIILFFDFSLHIPIIQILFVMFFILNKKSYGSS